MLQFYYSGAPNPVKVALFLEEAGLPYQAIPVDTRAGDQHKPDYMAINPNAKAPSIVDDGVAIFDSNAILLYLADKTGKFLPSAAADRGPLLSWLMLVASGVGPYSGQAVHFKHHAPEQVPYAVNRYDYEAHRHFALFDARLADRAFVMGDDYTIVDMALWGWARMVPMVLGADGFAELPHLKRLLDTINARPAAARAEALKEQHAFKTAMDDEARANMFPQNARLA